MNEKEGSTTKTILRFGPRRRLSLKKILAGFFRLLLLSGLVWLCLTPAAAADQDNSFSFTVFGDNRLPGYLSYTSDQTDEIEKCFDEMKRYAFGPDLVLDIDMGFDPDTHKLEWIKYWPKGAPERYRLVFLKNSWPRLIAQGPQADVILRSEGQAWIYTEIVRELKKGAEDPLSGPSFSLNTGDMTYFGYQGKSRNESPYWRDFYERFLSKLPPGGPEGLPGRFFPAPGNHETWLDENLEGLLSMTCPH